MPDFFLDDFDAYEAGQQRIKTGNAAAAGAAAGGSAAGSSAAGVQGVFDKIEGLLSEELVSKTKAVYQFNVKGQLLIRTKNRVPYCEPRAIINNLTS